MNKNTEQHTASEGRQQAHSGTPIATAERAQSPVSSPSQEDHRYTPLHKAVPGETYGYEWKRETGDIQSYRHNVTTGWLHTDPQGQFHNRQGHHVTKEAAFESAGHSPAYTLDPNILQNQQTIATRRGLSV